MVFFTPRKASNMKLYRVVLLQHLDICAEGPEEAIAMAKLLASDVGQVEVSELYYIEDADDLVVTSVGGDESE